MEFGGPGGPVFPTLEEQRWIDQAHQRIRDHEWPPDRSEVTGTTLSVKGFALSVGCMVLALATCCLMLWML